MTGTENFERAVDSSQIEHLTRGRLLAKNTLLSLGGQAIPLLVALVSIPILVKGIGVERFGLLSLFWVIFGYLALFDLGMGTAIIRFVSEKLAIGRMDQLAALVLPSLALIFVLSSIGALGIALATPYLVSSFFDIPLALRTEARASFYLLALGLPVMSLLSGFRGILEAQQRFDFTNSVQACLGASVFLVPLIVLSFSHQLNWIVAGIVLTRFVFLLIVARASLRSLAIWQWPLDIKPKEIARALHFGSWVTVSNIVSPLMVYLDRFLLGALVSVEAVAYYATPYEIITKLWVLPAAMVGVLFPAFALSHSTDSPKAVRLYEGASKIILIVMCPIVLVVFAIAPEGLDLWLGHEFSLKSAKILQILAVGVLFNCAARLPYALIQAAGRPKWTATIHLIELPIYLAAVWILTKNYGAIGAAIASSARMVIDLFLILFFAHKILPGIYQTFRPVLGILVGALLVCVVSLGWESILFKILFLMATLFIFGVIAWKLLLSASERKNFAGFFKRTN